VKFNFDKTFRFRYQWIISVLLVFTQQAYAAVTVPANVIQSLSAGYTIDVIVEYDSAEIEQEVSKRRKLTARGLDSPAILAYRSSQYRLLKQKIDSISPTSEITHLKDYSHLPMSFKRLSSLSALNTLIARNGIKAVYENGKVHPVLAQSLLLSNQPAVLAVGERGSGTTVAVIDNGIDFTNVAFGNCTAPGVPAGCHVNASIQFGTGTTDNNHGSNVSAIVLGMAPSSKIAMLNVFSGTSANFSDVISAINWSIANQATYNIVAINMSLGDGTLNTSPCSNSHTNPFVTPVNSAMSSGITVVASAGNEAYSNGLGNPACTPGVISVGAVYDANLGGLSWGSLCTDLATAADKVACFSDSASFLTMLAPGALITAAGFAMGGTSQASPHVAGAIAVLRSTFPAESLSQTQARMVNTGTSVNDARNGVTKPRLNLLEAARPANDAFAYRTILGGSTGSTKGTSVLATKENGEPNHAAKNGQASIWWKWIAPSTGQVSLDTHGSEYDTLLAVYTGAAVNALTPIASNDNDTTAGGTSSLLFQAQAGTEYEIATDGLNGVAGNTQLNWSLNTTAKANLSLSISGPTSALPGSTLPYVLTISNAGPQTATNVVTTVTLPTGASFVSGPVECASNGAIVTCMSGDIANGGSVSLVLQIMLSSSIASENLSARVTSDLPDPVPADSSANLQVDLSVNNENDVPTLPEWGQLIMAVMLGAIAITRRRKRQ
jgi:uncharacterized repeat protein (TIGR01451 family)